MAKLPVVNVNYGLGSVYDEIIEINYKLPTKLRARIIEHEQNHDTGGYTKKDFLNDFNSKNSYFLESLKFALFNPEALVGFFPWMYSYYFKKWTFNFSGLIPFVYFGLIFSLFFKLLFKVPFFNALIGYTVFFILMNLILILIAHIYVKRNKDFKYEVYPC